MSKKKIKKNGRKKILMDLFKDKLDLSSRDVKRHQDNYETKSFEEIRKIVNGVFDYHAVIDGDPDADDIFYIRLYGVPDDLVISTKTKLRNIIKEYWNDDYNSLIPSICSFSDTLEHYPEYLKLKQSI